MTWEIMDAAVALAAALAEENAALEALDYPRAAGLLARKQQTLDALAQAQRDAPGKRQTPPDSARREVAQRLAGELQTLAAENRRLLEQAIHVQRRVVGTVFKAAPRSVGGAARYVSSGAMAAARLPQPLVLSSRV